MELLPNKLYSRSDFQTYLASQKLPSSRPAILNYEKKKVIKRPSRLHEWRLYKGKEMVKMAEKIRAYVSKNYPYKLRQIENR